MHQKPDSQPAMNDERDDPKCRICGKSVNDRMAHFPFCSARCRDVDLGKWFGGDYKISREIKDSDLETVD